MAQVRFDAAGHTGIRPVRTFGDNMRQVAGQIDFSNKYPEGGEEVDLTDFFPTGPAGVLVAPQGGYVFEYDYAEGKVLVMEEGSEVAADTDLSSLEGVRFLAWGYA